MKIISVFYKDIQLGELTQIANTYYYKAIPKNIKEAHSKGYLTFMFNCDNDFASQELPYSIQNFIVPNKNIPLWQEANILPTDSDFEKLCKIASLKDVEYPDFYIKIKE